MKRLCFFTLLFVMIFLVGCGGRSEAHIPAMSGAEEPARIAIASDLHYLAPSLTDNGPLFRAVVEHGDGKLMLYSEEILEAFIDQMLEERPDALILSGDLTYNGEYESHTALIEKLKRLQEAGIQVLVISGNHDVNNPYSLRFHGDGYERVKTVASAEFTELYRDFGHTQALSVDSESGSYVYALRSDLRLLMLDTNSVVINSFPEKSLSWLEQQLHDAQESGAKVIAVSHQNLNPHNSLFTTGYRISNASVLRALFEKYGVICQLSGHMHIQHFCPGTVPELLTSALSLTPNRYGWLCYDGVSLRYEAMETDVEGWAARTGQTDDALRHFSQYARDFFYALHYAQIEDAYSDSGLEPDEVDELARLFAETNLAYFTGEPLDRDALAEGVAHWAALDESFHTAYLRSILQDAGDDPLHVLLWDADA